MIRFSVLLLVTAGFLESQHNLTILTMAGELVKVPDLLRAWSWQRHLNKNHDEAKAASLEWFASFKAFDAKSQDAFDRCDFGGVSSASCLTKSCCGD